jgi:hypothetical protein
MELLSEVGLIDASRSMYPSRLHLLESARSFDDEATTVYGAVISGRASVRTDGITGQLEPGSFFALPGPCEVDARERVMVVERIGYRAIACIGRIEKRGRLVYIDGCSDSILCAPARLGDPVLNHLHFPARTEQSIHVHPTRRMGVVVRGRGIAFGVGWKQSLEPGFAFSIEEHERHAFRTLDESMDVIAFHPDSDWGPTDAAHPMLNRTYVCKPKV